VSAASGEPADGEEAARSARTTAGGVLEGQTLGAWYPAAPTMKSLLVDWIGSEFLLMTPAWTWDGHYS
jgi:hypothetical protein